MLFLTSIDLGIYPWTDHLLHVGAEEDDENYGILRASVPGGWLMATVEGGPEDTPEPKHYTPGGIPFYPDASHAWNPTPDRQSERFEI
jgi:hypothetical protein